jgi:hypothetical protein
LGGMIPATIYKHWFGYVVIALAGLAGIGLAWSGFFSLMAGGQVDPQLVVGLGTFIIGMVALVTIVQLYVYGLSYIELGTDGVTVKNWITLFVSKDESFEWVRVSRAEVLKGEIFAQLLNYGTLSIETDGGHVLVKITMIPNVEQWQDAINAKADEATVDGTP